jgi:hypothetical protein
MEETTNHIPPELIHETKRSLDSILSLLEPYALSHAPPAQAGRLETLSSGGKIKDFVQKSYTFALKIPHFIPPWLDTVRLTTGGSGGAALGSRHESATRMLEYINTLRLASRGQTITTALTLYHAIKLAAARNLPGAQTALDELDAKLRPDTDNR